MKIIHCADLHLDSKLEANLTKEQAKLRKGEILNTFVRMADYASETGVSAILICGDMFDKSNISATVRNTVKNVFLTHPDIHFYYLKGNHDNDNFLDNEENLPSNLYMFRSEWTTYSEADGAVSITGAELGGNGSGRLYNSLLLDGESFNIVMLHGQESENVSSKKDKTELVNIKALKNKSIDYLALGHIHTFKEERLDARGIYCYSGCLEGRGFDECGEKGFVLLDIDTVNGTLTHDFIPFAQRRLYVAEADISSCDTSDDVIDEVNRSLRKMNCMDTDMLKIVLVGDTDISRERDDAYILAVFSERFFFAKLEDGTSPKVNYEDYKLDRSLKGEFVRCVLEDPEIPDEDKPYVIKYGIDAILSKNGGHKK